MLFSIYYIKVVDVWRCHWTSSNISTVSAEVVVASPPVVLDSNSDTMFLSNHKEVVDRIVVARRGGVPIVDKVRAVQQVGGLALVIVDDGSCGGKYDQACLPGASRDLGEGFAAEDDQYHWFIDILLILLLLLVFF